MERKEDEQKGNSQNTQSQQQQEEDQDYFETEEEIHKKYEKLLGKCMEIQNSYEDFSNDFAEIISQLKKVENSIRFHSLLSPNEPIEEIKTEYIKFFLLPFYLGDVFNRITPNRKKNLDLSVLYYNEYLKLLNHYQLLPKQLKQQWKNINENDKYEIPRDEKIANFKEKKQLENKLKNIEKVEDESVRREFYLYLINYNIHNVIDNLRLAKEEREILLYRESIQKDESAKQRHEEEMKKPLPKLTYYHIPKIEKNQEHFMFTTQQAQKPKKLDNYTLMGMSEQQVKHEFAQRVWQPGFGQPEETLDSFADREMMKLDERSKKEKESKLKQQAEDELDSDDEEVDDQKQKKARAWDDWKDANEKGAGNKKGRG